jgi:hypothetical protein
MHRVTSEEAPIFSALDAPGFSCGTCRTEHRAIGFREVLLKLLAECLAAGHAVDTWGVDPGMPDSASGPQGAALLPDPAVCRRCPANVLAAMKASAIACSGLA